MRLRLFYLLNALAIVICAHGCVGDANQMECATSDDCADSEACNADRECVPASDWGLGGSNRDAGIDGDTDEVADADRRDAAPEVDAGDDPDAADALGGTDGDSGDAHEPDTGGCDEEVAPVAAFEASLEDGSTHADGEAVEVNEVETIEFDASDSQARDGEIVRYEWALLDRPEESLQRIDDLGREVDLVVDAVGRYEVALRVVDDRGRGSCGGEARISIEVRPSETTDVYVELTWDTPGDPDQTDDLGADLDLHYLHENGRWDEDPWDIFWRNTEADWGREGDESDDPQLTIDDTDGAGPEVVEHSELEGDVTYRVGVYCYNDGGFGRSDAKVRIFVDGELADEFEREIAETGQFWDAAIIRYRGSTVLAVDRLHEGFP